MRKLQVLCKLLFAKKFMLITGEKAKHIVSTYTEEEMARSRGKDGAVSVYIK